MAAVTPTTEGQTSWEWFGLPGLVAVAGLGLLIRLRNRDSATMPAALSDHPAGQSVASDSDDL